MLGFHSDGAQLLRNKNMKTLLWMSPRTEQISAAWFDPAPWTWSSNSTSTHDSGTSGTMLDDDHYRRLHSSESKQPNKWIKPCGHIKYQVASKLDKKWLDEKSFFDPRTSEPGPAFLFPLSALFKRWQEDKWKASFPGWILVRSNFTSCNQSGKNPDLPAVTSMTLNTKVTEERRKLHVGRKCSEWSVGGTASKSMRM